MQSGLTVNKQSKKAIMSSLAGLGLSGITNDMFFAKIMNMSPKERKQLKQLVEKNCAKMISQPEPNQKSSLCPQKTALGATVPLKFDFFITEQATIPPVPITAAP